MPGKIQRKTNIMMTLPVIITYLPTPPHQTNPLFFTIQHNGTPKPPPNLGVPQSVKNNLTFASSSLELGLELYGHKEDSDGV